ncbi:hypothetical protein KY389_05665 [Paracoccus bogoriensis]|nr:hypothetical protein [Paracoccus bogoriensis]
MLHAGWDTRSLAEMGGGKDAGIVLGHDPHAIKDRMIADAIFAAKLVARPIGRDADTIQSKRKMA